MVAALGSVCDISLPRKPRCERGVSEVKIRTKRVVLGVSLGRSKLLVFPPGLSQQPALCLGGSRQLSKDKRL